MVAAGYSCNVGHECGVLELTSGAAVDHAADVIQLCSGLGEGRPCESEGHRLVSVGIGCGRSQIRPSGVCRLIVQRLDIDGLHKESRRVGSKILLPHYRYAETVSPVFGYLERMVRFFTPLE